MKTYDRFFLAALLLAIGLGLAACGNAAGSGGSSGGMQGMDHEGMNGGSGQMKGMDHGGMAPGTLTKDGRYSDEAFIDNMVPHHQGAVEMAEVALDNAEHDEVVELARRIIASQKSEIMELKSIKQREFGTSNIPADMGSRQMGGMGMMKPGLLADERPFDRAFIDAMIPHHRSAIAMANVTLDKSDNPEIRTLAEDIVQAQKREIEQMESWRKEWYPGG